MSRQRYPRKYYSTDKRRGPGPCKGCGEDTYCFVEIEWTWFRGDDDRFRFCHKCRSAVKDKKGNDKYEVHRIMALMAKQQEKTG